MGTTKHAPAKPAPKALVKPKARGPVKKDAAPAPAPVVAKSARLFDALRILKEEGPSLFASLLAEVNDAVAMKDPKAAGSVVINQDHLGSMFVLGQIGGFSKAASKTLAALMKKYRAAGGSFESGKYTLLFNDTAKSNPTWKAEAIALAEQLAKLNGDDFDAEAWCVEIAQKYPPKPSTSIKVVDAIVDPSEVGEEEDDE